MRETKIEQLVKAIAAHFKWSHVVTFIKLDTRCKDPHGSRSTDDDDDDDDENTEAFSFVL